MVCEAVDGGFGWCRAKVEERLEKQEQELRMVKQLREQDKEGKTRELEGQTRELLQLRCAREEWANEKAMLTSHVVSNRFHTSRVRKRVSS